MRFTFLFKFLEHSRTKEEEALNAKKSLATLRRAKSVSSLLVTGTKPVGLHEVEQFVVDVNAKLTKCDSHG